LINEQASQGAPSVTVLDQVLWSTLAGTAPIDAFARAWLTLQCRQLDRVERAVLVLRGPDGLAPVARWPEGDRGAPELAQIAELALEERRGVASRGRGITGAEEARPSLLAFPLLDGDALEGVIAVQCQGAGDSLMRETMRALQWGASWIELHRRRAASVSDRSRLRQSFAALEVTACALNAGSFGDAARATATELAVRLQASRVAVGWLKRDRIALAGISHTVAIGERMDSVADLASAMDEAIDQSASLLYPVPAGAGVLGLRAHAALAGRRGAGAVLTVPLVVETEMVGAITVECADPAAIDQDMIDLVEAVAGLVGPALATARRQERWWIAIGHDIVRREIGHLIGPEHYRLKLGTLAAIAVIAFFALYTTDYQISGHAVVEGEVRRSIAASLDGYIASEHARAGQVVRRGDLLASLDGAELNLQRLRWIATREQHRLELNKALSAGQRAEVAIDNAQVEAANSEIALLDEEIARTRIVAPFDGLVISGDLSQSVGVPVQRAQVLFELAPLDSYRVVVRVPDSDVGRVVIGQTGQLVLSALPDDRFAVSVSRVTPVSDQVDGGNFFRVEAKLDRVSDRLRPNMEGVARLSTGEHHLIWIWSHHLIDTVRLWLWAWWP
jgi:multidrug resistance efflux pump